VISTDFYPTLLEITKSDKPANQPLDGKSIMPLLTQTGSFDRDAIFWHFPAYLQGYNASQGAFRTTPASAIRKGDYKLIEFFEDNKLELYNLKEDISESNDLAKKLPAKTKELYNDMLKWRKSVSAPIPTKLNPLYDPNKKIPKKKKGKK
jgi:arylsulfatase A-like enzyme